MADKTIQRCTSLVVRLEAPITQRNATYFLTVLSLVEYFRCSVRSRPLKSKSGFFCGSSENEDDLLCARTKGELVWLGKEDDTLAEPSLASCFGGGVGAGENGSLGV